METEGDQVVQLTEGFGKIYSWNIFENEIIYSNGETIFAIDIFNLKKGEYKGPEISLKVIKENRNSVN